MSDRTSVPSWISTAAAVVVVGCFIAILAAVTIRIVAAILP